MAAGGLDPFAPELLADTDAALARLRAQGPLVRVAALDAHLVIGHDLVAEILDDPVTHSNGRDSLGVAPDPALAGELAAIRADGRRHRPTIADEDLPLHDAYRSIVAPHSTPARKRAFRPALTTVGETLIDGWDVDARLARLARAPPGMDP